MSSEHDDAIKDAYAAFWQKRDAVKKRQRKELEDQTSIERVVLARALWSARRSTEKYTVRDIADLLGLTNRNFLYTVMNDKPLNTATKPVGRPSSAEKNKKADKEKSAPFHLRAEHTNTDDIIVYNALTGIATTYSIEITAEDRILEIPEDWFVDTLTPDEVQFYKDLIKQIEKGE